MSVSLRLRYLLAKHGPALTAALLVLGTVLLGAAGVAYAAPPTTEVTDHTDRRTVTSSLATAATVTGNSSVYERGDRLRNQPVYLLDATPTVNLSLVTEMPDGVSGDVDHQLDLVYTAQRDGETFWQHTETVALETIVDDGETVSTAVLSMREVREQRSSYQSEFGPVATVSVAVRSSTSYTVGQYEGNLSTSHPVTVGGSSYSIDADEASNTHSTPVTSTRGLPLWSHLQFVLPLAGGVVLLLTGVLTGVSVWRSSSTSEDTLADAVHHSRYADWVSSGQIPTTRGSTVQMASLEALVDVAIDSHKRVIYDPDRGAYAVLDDGVQYRYVPE